MCMFSSFNQSYLNHIVTRRKTFTESCAFKCKPMAPSTPWPNISVTENASFKSSFRDWHEPKNSSFRELIFCAYLYGLTNDKTKDNAQLRKSTLHCAKIVCFWLNLNRVTPHDVKFEPFCHTTKLQYLLRGVMWASPKVESNSTSRNDCRNKNVASLLAGEERYIVLSFYSRFRRLVGWKISWCNSALRFVHVCNFCSLSGSWYFNGEDIIYHWRPRVYIVTTSNLSLTEFS